MKYVKILGLAAMAAAALMAFIGAGTASASVLCSAKENPCSAANKWPNTTNLLFTLKSNTSAKLVDTEGNTLDTCTGSTVEGEVEKVGSATTTVTGPVTRLLWSGCTFTTTTTQLSKLEGHVTGTGPNGTLTSDGEFKVTINTVLFGSCVYGVTAGTALGSVTGGASATFVANAIANKLSGSNVACPTTSKWTAEYVSTGTTALFFAVS